MGCGHSKINIYPRKKTKSSSRKTVTPEKAESEEEDGIENDSEANKDTDDGDPKKTIKVKPFGGPLLAQVYFIYLSYGDGLEDIEDLLQSGRFVECNDHEIAPKRQKVMDNEISSSQQDFFKMLEEKIENGPDYNSESETEREVENARIRALLKDWETASAGSRSLPSTPKKRQPMMTRSAAAAAAESNREAARVAEGSVRGYQLPQSAPISQSVIHQSYGITQIAYRQVNYTPNHPNYISQGSPSSSHAPPHPAAYSSALQYQAISPPIYPSHIPNNPAHPISVPHHPGSVPSQPGFPPSMPSRQYPSYNQYGTPIQTYSNSSTTNSPMKHHHIPPTVSYVEQSHLGQPIGAAYSSPTHKLYGSPVQVAKPQAIYSNGELSQPKPQQNMYNHQVQYLQYKDSREQVLVQTPQPPQGSYRQVPRSYQTSVTIPIVVKSNNNENPVNNALLRKQYELT